MLSTLKYIDSKEYFDTTVSDVNDDTHGIVSAFLGTYCSKRYILASFYQL